MFFERELLKRIPQYKAEGILDSDSAERLIKKLQNQSEGRATFFAHAIYIAESCCC